MEENKNVYRLQGLSCTNCAAKFEKNIRDIPSVEDVQLNFGASKLTVQGNASVEQLEQAGGHLMELKFDLKERKDLKKRIFLA
ncbi:lead, cadmium, zinc and mercury transporting ATPase [Gracilibacillus boraciitolerans JCM 21714]|uniref:Lead, cadmium, zinc and mercury transporting ATPase n=1 Tax=Gracilibacillus boraciitolerans JCM 21714 TaxID=1298598 RepID=W4VHD0_9BACI|nr:lead, cadmium, zinc and mercury transporting ATPase [Gracilibacillus boraciitolerans JCM 21714]